MDFIYWPVHSSSRRGKDGVKDVDWGRIVILASITLLSVHENLV